MTTTTMTIRKDKGRCSDSKPWAVLSGDGSKLLGCHETRKGAVAQLQAIEINKSRTLEKTMKIMEKLGLVPGADLSKDVPDEVETFFYGDLNDEELLAEWMFSSSSYIRLVENALKILKVMQDRDLEQPTDTALWGAMYSGDDLDDDLKADIESGKILLKNLGKVADKLKDDPDIIRPIPVMTDDMVKGRGPKRAVVAFVGASPSKLDYIRKHAFSGSPGRTLQDVYIEPLGLSESDVFLTNIVPEYLEDEHGNPREPTTEEVEKWMQRDMEANVDYIVALGKTARDALGDSADEWVPHPRAVAIYGDSGEVGRKLARLKKSIEAGPDLSEDRPLKKLEDFKFSWRWGATTSDGLNFAIVDKSQEKQIVYGEVMVPYEEDTDGNWSTPEEIEKAAHYFMEHFRQMDHEHMGGIDDSVPVESFVASDDMTMGDKVVKAGTWVMGVKVNDDKRWAAVKNGTYSGFSIQAKALIDPSLRLNV